MEKEHANSVVKLVRVPWDKGMLVGARPPRPAQDYGFIIQRTFEDIDGYTWEPFFMDPTHLQQ